MRHLRDSNKFQFIHKILLKRLKRFLSKLNRKSGYQIKVYLQILRPITKLEFQMQYEIEK